MFGRQQRSGGKGLVSLQGCHWAGDRAAPKIQLGVAGQMQYEEGSPA